MRSIRAVAACGALLIAGAGRSSKADFSQAFYELPETVSLVGACRFQDGLGLTAGGTGAGGVWFGQRQGVADGFVATLRVSGQPFDVETGYAPGFALVLHDDPAGASALGASGGGMGFAGITRSLAVVFDTSPDPASEFPGQHVSLRTRGNMASDAMPDTLLAAADLDALGIDLLDGHPQAIVVQYAAPLGEQAGLLEVFVRGVRALSAPLNLRAMSLPSAGGGSEIVDITAAGLAHVGVTGGANSLSPSITLVDWAFVENTSGCIPPRWYGLDWSEGPPGGSARLGVQAVGTYPLSYAWFRGSEPVQADPEGRIAGLGTPTLRISGLGPADAGRYSCLITSACGAVTTGEMPIFPCRADLNRDGVINPDDLADFIACYFQEVGLPGSCPGANFNGQDAVDPDDLADYIAAYFSGC